MRLRAHTILGSALGDLVLFLILTLSLGAQAAGRGGLSGLVTDSSGGAIPGATVVLTNTATNVTQHGESSGAGLYAFVGLVPGEYTLQVSHVGFKATQQQHITIVVDQSAKVNVSLQVGAENQQVTVSAAPALVATTNATTGQLIDTNVITRMPLVNRDVYQLAELSPGMVPGGGAESNLDSQRAEVAGFSVNGTMSGTLSYMLDGSPITLGENNPGTVVPALSPPLDDVQEYRLDLSTVPANFQSAGAGVISVVTKSGTNDFHGDAFGFIRPNALDANDTFNKANELENGQPNKPTVFSRKQFGGSIGGPIIKNKMFFFGDYEGTRQKQATTLTTTVPTKDEKQGLFAFPIYNPFDIANGPNCPAPAAACPQPFAGNQIPSGMINPVATAYLSGWPAPNAPGSGPYHVNNFFASGPVPMNANRFDVRIDDALTGTQHLFGRVSWAHANQEAGPNFFNSVLYPTGGTLTHDGNVQLGYDWAMSSNTVLELRSSLSRQTVIGGPSNQYGYDMTKLGFPSSLAKSSVFDTVPGIEFSSVSGFGGAVADEGLGSNQYAISTLAETDYDVDATLDFVHGRHQMSIGWEYQKLLMNGAQPVSPAGVYNFDAAATSSNATADDGSAFASFLLGIGSLNNTFNFTDDLIGAFSSPYTGLFFQDDIHLSPTLTLNAGVRWDYFGSQTERYNRLSYFDPNIQYTVNGVSLTGGDQFPTTSNPNQFIPNKGNFSPRFGLTWQAAKSLVIRSGFGFYYGPSVHAANTTNYATDGFTSVNNWQAASVNSNGDIVPGHLVNNPFPNGILTPTGSALGPATNLGSTISTMPRSGPDPLTYNFNFGVQYQLPGETVVSAAWVGSRGLHLPLQHFNLNTIPLATLQKYGPSLNDPVPFPYEAAITDPSAVWYQHAEVPQWVMLTKYPQFTDAQTPNPLGEAQVLVSGMGDSIYHSFQAKLEKRLTHSFTFLSAFTWSKLITDDGEGAAFFFHDSNTKPQSFDDMRLERSLSNQDVPVILTFEGSWDLPIGTGRAVGLNGWANQALGGWTVSSILSLTSGVPISTPTGTGDLWMRYQRPDLAGNCGVGAQRTPESWFNYSCLAAPTNPYAPGTAPAVLPGIRADGTSNLDLSIAKHFPMGEQRDLEFRFAAYNFTNSVQYGYPHAFWHATPTSSNMSGFGQVTSAANTPRQVSAQLRFTF